jgi:hypothetical protein
LDYWNLFLLLVKIVIIAAPFGIGLALWSATSENSGYRAVYTYLLHLLIFGIGWLFGKWNGIFLISLPLLIFYFYFLILVAWAVVPTSTAPRKWGEKILRARYFFFYMWGFQYPAWVVNGSTGRIAETRIKGDQSRSWAAPGFIWAYSHQVVGLTTGINFSRAEIPGTVFTQTGERPIEGVVDLRTQKRTFWIDVVSSDGIPFRACLSASFAVDKEKWGRELYLRLIKEDRLLKEAIAPDYTDGSFPFSKQRIRALLSSTGIHSSTIKKVIESEATKKAAESKTAKKTFEHDPDKKASETEAAKKTSESGTTRKASKSEKTDKSSDSETKFWDEIVLYHVEKAASEVLSQRRFDEIWLPADDHAGACAPDEIAEAIKNRCSFNLRCRGIHLFSCGLVDFQFEREKVVKTGQVERQQIAVWQADWQRDTLETRARGDAEAELLRQEARAYAYATLLTAVADGLQSTITLDPDLPRHLIAMRFIAALEEMLQHQPDESEKNEVSSAIRKWKLRLSPGSNRE